MDRSCNGPPFSPGAESHSSGAAEAPSPSPARSHFAFSTQDIPAEGKFESWRDLWMKTIEVEVSTLAPVGFNGEIEMWEAGPLAIASVLVKPTLYDRTRRLAANGEDDF